MALKAAEGGGVLKVFLEERRTPHILVAIGSVLSS